MEESHIDLPGETTPQYTQYQSVYFNKALFISKQPY